MLHGFLTRKRSLFEKREHAIPIHRAAKAQAKHVFVLRLRGPVMSQFSELGRGPVIHTANGSVEAPHAPEAGGQRDMAHRQSSLVDQLFDEMQSPRLHHSDGWRAQMLQEQTPQMS